MPFFLSVSLATIGFWLGTFDFLRRLGGLLLLLSPYVFIFLGLSVYKNKAVRLALKVALGFILFLMLSVWGITRNF